jgi:hypothetical protein
MGLEGILTGVDGFGGELWNLEPSWWDTSALFQEYRDKAQSTGLAPAWQVRLSPKQWANTDQPSG